MAALAFLVLPAVCFSSGLVLTEGWRSPTPAEAKPEQAWRSEVPNRYLSVTGDFSGDGRLDHALLLVRKEGGGFALFALVSQKDGSERAYLLDENKNPDYLEVMGVSVTPPGKYRTACGKGYFECLDGEPEEIVLRRPAINYFKEGAANSFFYWDETQAGFKRIWMSD